MPSRIISVIFYSVLYKFSCWLCSDVFLVFSYFVSLIFVIMRGCLCNRVGWVFFYDIFRFETTFFSSCFGCFFYTFCICFPEDKNVIFLPVYRVVFLVLLVGTNTLVFQFLSCVCVGGWVFCLSLLNLFRIPIDCYRILYIVLFRNSFILFFFVWCLYSFLHLSWSVFSISFKI